MILKGSLKFSNKQLVILSEISRDIAQIFFASMVISPFLLGVDQINWGVIISGGIVSLGLWVTSVIIVKK